jgi:hypothetical protein
MFTSCKTSNVARKSYGAYGREINMYTELVEKTTWEHTTWWPCAINRITLFVLSLRFIHEHQLLRNVRLMQGRERMRWLPDLWHYPFLPRLRKLTKNLSQHLNSALPEHEVAMLPFQQQQAYEMWILQTEYDIMDWLYLAHDCVQSSAQQLLAPQWELCYV